MASRKGGNIRVLQWQDKIDEKFYKDHRFKCERSARLHRTKKPIRYKNIEKFKKKRTLLWEPVDQRKSFLRWCFQRIKR